MADAVVLLLHYGRPADLALLDLLDAAGHRGAIAVLAVADEAGPRRSGRCGSSATTRPCAASVTPSCPSRRRRPWPRPASATTSTGGCGNGWRARRSRATGERTAGRGPHVLAAAVSRPATLTAAPATDAEPEIATALLERLGPLGARRAVRLVRGGEGETHAELAGALVRHSGLGELQELIGSRFLSRADALRSRSVLAGLAALLQAVPPPSDYGRRPAVPAGTGPGRCARAARARASRRAALRRPAPPGRAAVPRPNGCSAPTVTTPAPASASAATPRPGRCGPQRRPRRPGGGRSRPTRWSRRACATPHRSWCGRASGWRPRSRPPVAPTHSIPGRHTVVTSAPARGLCRSVRAERGRG